MVCTRFARELYAHPGEDARGFDGSQFMMRREDGVGDASDVFEAPDIIGPGTARCFDEGVCGFIA